MGLFGGLFGRKDKAEKDDAIDEAELDRTYPRSEYTWHWHDRDYVPEGRKGDPRPGKELVIEDKYGNIVYRKIVPASGSKA